MAINNNNNGQLISSVSHPVATYNHPLQTKIDYNGTSAAVYVGYALPGSATSSQSWMIQYITYDVNGNTTATQWSPNYAYFGDIWDNRASLSYL